MDDSDSDDSSPEDIFAGTKKVRKQVLQPKSSADVDDEVTSKAEAKDVESAKEESDKDSVLGDTESADEFSEDLNLSDDSSAGSDGDDEDDLDLGVSFGDEKAESDSDAELEDAGKQKKQDGTGVAQGPANRPGAAKGVAAQKDPEDDSDSQVERVWLAGQACDSPMSPKALRGLHRLCPKIPTPRSRKTLCFRNPKRRSGRPEGSSGGGCGQSASAACFKWIWTFSTFQDLDLDTTALLEGGKVLQNKPPTTRSQPSTALA